MNYSIFFISRKTMAFVDELLNKAKAANKTIVLCEGEDKRVVEAA